MKKIKVYVIGDNNYANWLPNYELVSSLEECDLVIFTGGEDVDTSLYGEPRNSTTYSNLHRDLVEREYWKKAVESNKYIMGICRGSQFSCVMNGGKLVQNQPNPLYRHNMITNDGRNIYVTSTHHQAQFPYGLQKEDYKLIGWTKDLLDYHEDGNHKEMNPEFECEIVYYPKTKCLAIQSHPEMVFHNYEHNAVDKEYIDYVRELLNKLITNELN